VPNFSEGRDQLTIHAIAVALSRSADLLDAHSDPDHNRTVYTLAGTAQSLSDAVVQGAGVAIDRIDLGTHEGAHPHVGVLDVAPFVYTEPADRGRAATRVAPARAWRCPGPKSGVASPAAIRLASSDGPPWRTAARVTWLAVRMP
jgi:hypothetical protein